MELRISKGKHPKQMFQRRISQLVNVSIQAPASDISNTNITDEVMNELTFDKLNSVQQMKVRPTGCLSVELIILQNCGLEGLDK